MIHDSSPTSEYFKLRKPSAQTERRQHQTINGMAMRVECPGTAHHSDFKFILKQLCNSKSSQLNNHANQAILPPLPVQSMNSRDIPAEPRLNDLVFTERFCHDVMKGKASMPWSSEIQVMKVTGIN